MKKLYSFLAAIAFVTTMNAQGAETFETQTALTASYADGTFAGETAGVTVNYVHSRDQDTFGITGKGLMLRRTDESSSVTFLIPNGVGTFSFKYRKAFTGGTNNRVLAVVVDGVETTVIPAFGAAGEDTTVYTSNTVINKSGAVTVKITYPAGTQSGNKQVTIDDVIWSANGVVLGVNDLSTVQNNFVKSTFIDSDINFGAKADVKIFSMNGQVVKSASVSENKSMNVADLAPGMYIVTGMVNGEAVSQKIMKK